MADFEAFPKIPRLNRDITITEKIDGTNAAVIIEEIPEIDFNWLSEGPGALLMVDGKGYRVQAQSRKRLITPESDNFGFARWVDENAGELCRLLGPGRHFGEWWGQGIQRRYGLDHKRFSLFNVARYAHLSATDSNLDVYPVPVLYRGPFLLLDNLNGDLPHQEALWELRTFGSKAAPGFMDPEGIIIYHEAARQLFKVTCVGDEKPKGSSE